MKVYFFDDGKAGFYSAVFNAYEQKRENDAYLTSLNTFQCAFGDESERVETDETKAARVQKSVRLFGGMKADNDIKTAFRSDCPEKAQIAFCYVKRLLKEKRDISRSFSFDEVMPFNTLVDKVWLERHRFTGFLRFEETKNGFLYAEYAPDNDITDLLAPHFVKRINLPFVICDVKRNRFAAWNGKELALFDSEMPTNILRSKLEKDVNALWRGYFKATNVKERPHPKQQDGYLPRRYRKFMSEFDEEE